MTDITLEQFRNAQGLRQAGRDHRSPVLYRRAAAEFRSMGWLANAEYCDRRAEHYERLEGDAK